MLKARRYTTLNLIRPLLPPALVRVRRTGHHCCRQAQSVLDVSSSRYKHHYPWMSLGMLLKGSNCITEYSYLISRLLGCYPIVPCGSFGTQCSLYSWVML